jgi:hypothetical protein
MLEMAWVVGPGMGSARSKFFASSLRQKYCEANSSGRHTICAPWRAADSIPFEALSRFAERSELADI